MPRVGRAAACAALLLALAAGAAAQAGIPDAAAASPPGPPLAEIPPTGSYLTQEPGTGDPVRLIPNTAAVAGPALAPDTTAASAEACSRLCRQAAGCSWFHFCARAVSGWLQMQSSRVAGRWNAARVQPPVQPILGWG